MKTVRMISAGDVTEVNLAGVLYSPRDDGSFMIPETWVGEARKANLVPAPLSAGDKIARILDSLDELDDGERQALHHVIATRAAA